MDLSSNLLSKAQRLFRHVLGKDNEEKWQEQYARGEWAWLRNLDELAHHSILAGYFMRLKPKGSLLDMGCGEGILQESIPEVMYSKYVGVDFSEPIKLAAHKCTERTHFVVGDMNTYVPEEQFDAIVFNESIYYLHNPLKGFQRYAQYLKPNGIFLVSMFVKDKHEQIWREIESAFPPIDAVTVYNQKGIGWKCKVLAPL
ncbi:MAG: class I SAM-dependent methyltransferase [Chloroherpetonaceae bacterium]|nr:class I SAM-dependent methyltransferase [Chloroherpetonaceae bacterium]MCS7210340.1 class I SAM-dependent methyltransferase [Chloroherpetonaceae bacterium]MDW8019079.1 class I SAM-dependent methyltransferase [Chloroherpetonaceae bacterium]MDW8465547.1 class I SAM-dependent methyltransferase [Chloroherpetonaceae bacterium]